jgi:DNA polymerase-3 subunit delta'
VAKTPVAVPAGRVLPAEFLLNPLSLGELVHPPRGADVFPAVLLSGAEGSGKASLAWGWGCALNCQAPGVSGRACGTCRSCRRFLDGQHPDLCHLAVGEDSQGVKIEQVRDLQARLDYRPFEATWRLVVLERVESMSEGAANCLLKTLEEPPPQTIFALLTTNHAKVLPTIHSRCRIFKLLPVEEARLTEWLVRHGAAQHQAALAARLTEGAPGRALARLADKPWWTLREQALQQFALITSGQVSPASLAEAADGVVKSYGTSGRARLVDYLSVGVGWCRDGLLVSQGAPAGLLLNVDREAPKAPGRCWTRAVDLLVDARLQIEGYTNARMVFTLLFQQLHELFAKQP